MLEAQPSGMRLAPSHRFQTTPGLHGPGGEKEVEIWLPQSEITELIALRTDARRPLDAGRPGWLHYGSTISQGAGAARPTGTWPAIAARLAGADLTNLASGSSDQPDSVRATAC